MKKIIVSLVLLTHLQLISIPASMIINRSQQPITVNYIGASGPLFSTGAISVNGSSNHVNDQMILIPSTAVPIPGSSPVANYSINAVSANITIGNTTVSIPSFIANTSYVIIPGTTAGTFIITSGPITYDTVTGIAIPGSPSPVAPGAGF